MREAIFDRPAADLRAVYLEIKQARGFAGGKAVRTGRLAGKAFAQKLGDFLRPGGGVIAAGNARNPVLLTALGASPEVVGVKFIKARFAQIELLAGLCGVESAGAELGKDMADQRRRAAMQ